MLFRSTESTYTALTPIADDPTFIVIEDLTDEDAPRINYNDLGADGVVTPVADQEEAPSHSGIVSFNADNYKIADTVKFRKITGRTQPAHYFGSLTR